MIHRYVQVAMAMLMLMSVSVVSHAESDDKLAQIFDKVIYERDLDAVAAEDKDAEVQSERVKRQIRAQQREMRKARLSMLIWQNIVDKLVDEHQLTPSAQEIADYRAFKQRFGNATDEFELTDEQQQERLDFDKKFVTSYKVDKFLYEKYGGKVVFQQSNPSEPVEAYQLLLKEYERNGDLVFFNSRYESAFWQYFEQDHNLVIPENKVDFSVPWWEKMMRRQ